MVKYLQTILSMEKIRPDLDSKLYSITYKLLMGIALVYLYFF
jgi:hypothetical protein